MSEQIPSRLSRSTRSWFVDTALSPYAEPYATFLIQRGYAAGTVESYVRGVAHFAYWSSSRLAVIEHLDESLIRVFVDEHLPDCACTPRCVRTRANARAALGHLLVMLRCAGLIASPPTALPAAVVAELEAFRRHLLEVRGLQAVTCDTALMHVGQFLFAHWPAGAIDITGLAPIDIERFTRRHTAGWKPASVKRIGTALRSYLCFKTTQGLDTAQLSASVPRVAQWRMSRLPRGLTDAEVHQLLDAFDRTSPGGQRDYAIARCYVDLGLRTSEIVRLELQDLDWRSGKLYVRGKGQRTDVLPLPNATGRAIVEYLRRGRPRTASRALFVRHRPPLDKPATADTIRAAIRNAAGRIGLEHRLTGTHILRHTVACRLVRSGASLKAIADLLRHRQLDTTTIYAKVDLDALRDVAAPWPEPRS